MSQDNHGIGICCHCGNEETSYTVELTAPEIPATDNSILIPEETAFHELGYDCIGQALEDAMMCGARITCIPVPAYLVSTIKIQQYQQKRRQIAHEEEKKAASFLRDLLV